MASSIKKGVNAAPSYRAAFTLATLDNIAFETPYTACAGNNSTGDADIEIEGRIMYTKIIKAMK